MNICYIHYMISKDEGKYSDEIFCDIYDQIEKSGLLEKLSQIKVVTLGNQKNLKTDFSKYSKVFHANHNNDLLSFEFPTLKQISNDANQLDDNTCILYLHLKNVSNQKRESTEAWKKRMLDCVVHNHEVCIDKLKTYNAVGTEYCDTIPKINGKIPRHYSGNFWWASAKHIKNLPFPDYKILLKTHGFLVKNRNNRNPAAPVHCNWRYLAEFWIALNDMDEQHNLCHL